MAIETIGTLKVLIANEEQERLDELAAVVRAAGHEVVARSVRIEEVAAIAADEEPDLAIVAAGESTEHALELVTQLAEETECPVIVATEGADAAFVERAAQLGVFGNIVTADPAELRSNVEIVFRRYSEYRNLEEALHRRALIERAKGILMERHGFDERQAFDILRDEARRRAIRIVEVAQAVLAAHPLLPKAPVNSAV